MVPPEHRSRRAAVTAAFYLASIVAALGMVGLFLAFAGFPVFDAYVTIFTTSFGSSRGLVSTLNHFAPLLLLSLAFTIPLLTRKFNIGGEGQLLIGATGAAAVGILLEGATGIVLVPLVVLAGSISGGLWALVAASLAIRFRISEILTTVLLNFVAVLIVAYAAGVVWPDPVGGHALYTVPVVEAARLPTLVIPPLHIGLILAVVVSLGVIGYLRWTPGGYEYSATGANERAAAVFGINVRRIFRGAFFLGGASAGLAGAIEVAGVHDKLLAGMQGNFMILGIVVGLLSRGSIMAVPFVALIVSVLEIGASATQRTIGLPAEMVLIVLGLVLLFVLLSDFLQSRLRGTRWIRI